MRETVAILELLGVGRSHGAIWQWTHRLVDSSSSSPADSDAWVSVAIDVDDIVSSVPPSSVATDDVVESITLCVGVDANDKNQAVP